MQFGNHLTDTPAQEQIKSIGELPVRKSAGNIYADDINRTTGFSVIENGRSMGRFPENGDIRVLWQNAVQQVWKREKSPKEALDEMCRLSEPIMAKNAARGGRSDGAPAGGGEVGDGVEDGDDGGRAHWRAPLPPDPHPAGVGDPLLGPVAQR